MGIRNNIRFLYEVVCNNFTSRSSGLPLDSSEYVSVRRATAEYLRCHGSTPTLLIDSAVTRLNKFYLRPAGGEYVEWLFSENYPASW